MVNVGMKFLLGGDGFSKGMSRCHHQRHLRPDCLLNFSHVRKTAGETRNGELLSNTVYDVSKTPYGFVSKTPRHEPMSN